MDDVKNSLPIDFAMVGREGSPSRPQSNASGGGFGETALPCDAFTCHAAHGRDGSPSRPQSNAILPVRKQLSHDVPSVVPPWIVCNAVFFITINTYPHEKNQLANKTVFEAIIESVLHRQSMGQMWAKYVLLMPDHLHGLFLFSPDHPMHRVIADWKRFLAKKCKIEWQRDFFDHRIRKDESETEKWNYIRLNPGRKEWVSDPDEWPYQWTNDGGFGETALPCDAFA